MPGDELERGQPCPREQAPDEKTRGQGCLRSYRLLALVLLPWLAPAAELAAPAPAPLPEPAIIERGAHHRKWQTVTAVQAGARTVLKTNTYLELGSGICFP